jgi:predicted dienelactone hydrolase
LPLVFGIADISEWRRLDVKSKIYIISTIFIIFSLNVEAEEIKIAGLIIKKVFNPEREKLVDIYYWYPAKTADANFEFGGNKFFKGTVASLGAKISEGKFPIILLSIGGMRTSLFHSGWVASGLAIKGFVVAVPQPPSAKSLKPGLAANELWLRPSDLSLSLSYLEKKSPLKDSVSTDHVYGVGFFLGGTSMLSLAGAEFDPNLYRASCKQDGVNIDCNWFRENKVDLENLPYKKLSRSMQDTRIKSIVAINPELTKTLRTNSLRRISIPISIIDIREDSDEYPGFDLADSLQSNPEITISIIQNSNLFSAFSTCTPEGVAVFATKAENICKDPKGIGRQEIHRLIIDNILEFIKAKKTNTANSGAKRRAVD